ncbi:unnamed protein product [Soboliphyme baturini]|uniref:Protein sel-1-like protein 1 n=1 Tax=Soboliphyme baturini TaxID=241478 RepID=A0A183IJ81_9BILA|nr:unnamed protein product [Soboliphyme baturini]
MFKNIADLEGEGNEEPKEDQHSQAESAFEAEEPFSHGSQPVVQDANYLKAETIYQEAMKYIDQIGVPSQNLKTGYRILLEAVTLNHTKAMELVAFAYLFGDYLPWNLRKAEEMFDRLAIQGSPRGNDDVDSFTHIFCDIKALTHYMFAALGGDVWAQMVLGYRYLNGVNLHQSCESALTYYRKVAQKVSETVRYTGGQAMQRIRLSDELEDQSGTQSLIDENLLQYYKFLADKGDVQAQVGLAHLYLSGGRGVEQDSYMALHYFNAAAEAGNLNAVAYLGKMYLDGSPATPVNNETALKYFQKAADQVNGLGVPRDYQVAMKYFQLASQSGHIMGFYNLAQMHATGTGVIRNCLTAVELYKNVAERGKWAAMLMEAYNSFQAGFIDQAVLKYLFLAELGYEVAQFNTAFLLHENSVKLFDKPEIYKRALLLWQRSASQGFGVSRVKVGDYYYYGLGTKQDYEEAANNYKTASEQLRNAQAMFNLAYMHENGLGIKKDLHLAKRFYDMAAEANPEAVVPVMFALMKLYVLFALEFFSKVSFTATRGSVTPMCCFSLLYEKLTFVSRNIMNT